MTLDTFVTVAGYVASGLVAVTFMMRMMIPLRKVAIASNVAFIAYGALGQLYPVLILHLFLLPLNIYRLRQMQKLVEDVKKSSKGYYSFEWLVKYMTKHTFKKGDVIFEKGDPAEKMYYIQEGTIVLPDVNVTLGAGDVLGEMGLFAPEKKRTARAVCESDVITHSITHDSIMQLYYQNPTFGFYLVQLLSKRYIENIQKLENRQQIN